MIAIYRVLSPPGFDGSPGYTFVGKKWEKMTAQYIY